MLTARLRSCLSLALLAPTIALAGPPLDGTLDTGFNNTGRRTVAFDLHASGLDAGRDVVVDAQGRVYLVGTVVAGNGDNQMGIARLLPTGALDTSYGNNGRVVAAAGAQITGIKAAFDSQGALLVAGSRQISGTNEDFAVCRFDSSGQLAAFPGNPQSLACLSIPFDIGGDNRDLLRDIAVDGQGRIYLAGNVGFSSSFVQAGVMRLLPNGTLDASYGNGGRTFHLANGSQRHDVRAMALQSNGRVWLAGAAVANGRSDTDAMILRLNATGGLDGTLNGTGIRTYSVGEELADMQFNAIVFDQSMPQTDSPHVLVVGQRQDGVGSSTLYGMAGSLRFDGLPRIDFGINGFDTYAGGSLAFNDVVQHSDGTAVAVGTTTPAPGVPSDFFAVRIGRLGGQDNSFNAPQGRIAIDFGTSGGQDTGLAIAHHRGRYYLAGSVLWQAPTDLDFGVVALNRERIFRSRFQTFQ